MFKYNIIFITSSLGALWQVNLKNFFAYSAITNTGFILLAFINFNITTIFSAYFYLIIYLITTIITFYSFIIIRPRQFNSSQLFSFNNFKCLGLINPLLLFSISLNFLSFAGIPPLPGFFSKFLILISLIEVGNLKLTFFMILISLFAAYYYIRPIKIIVFSMLLKPKFLLDIPFFSVFFISSFFLFNLQFLILLDPLVSLFSYDIININKIINTNLKSNIFNFIENININNFSSEFNSSFNINNININIIPKGSCPKVNVFSLFFDTENNKK